MPKNDSSDSSSSSDENPPETKKAKAEPKSCFNSEGKLDLPGKRQLDVRTFKGKVYIDIREYYEKDGEMLPGKKGISLTREQWAIIRDNVDAIDTRAKNLAERNG